LIPPADQLEWDLRWATGINDGGQIVGIAIRTIGGVEFPGRAFLLTPVPTLIGTSYCSGDGTGVLCPCGNTGASGAGCAASSGIGALLVGTGSASLASDSLVFTATDLLPAQPTLLFAGENAVN